LNGTWPNSGNPATGANEMYQDNDMKANIVPSHSFFTFGTISCTTNFGASSFAHTPPTGYSGWTT